MKYLGVDYGLSYVGLALSDESGSFAFPYSIVKTKEALDVIRTLLTQERIVGIVYGGGDTVREQAAHVLGQLNDQIPLYEENENFSSVEAHRYQTDPGRRDDSAAAIILQRFLDKKKK